MLFFAEKSDVTRAFMITGILFYEVALLLLAVPQIKKKDISQKTLAPAF